MSVSSRGAGIDRRAGIVRLCQRRSTSDADYDFRTARPGGRTGAHRSEGTDFERYHGATLPDADAFLN